MFKILIHSLMLIPGLVLAEPYVIFDSGMGISTASYKGLFNNDNISDIRDSWVFGQLPVLEADDKEKSVNIYPINTTKLTPKRLDQPQEGYFPRLLYPICVVGDDELSLAWLERNREHLGQAGAQCFIVSAYSAESAAPLIELLSGIPSYPADGDAIADYFGIKHYPVLITDRYASQ
jgi:integrating conjugative element protein (TIGR03765 family)